MNMSPDLLTRAADLMRRNWARPCWEFTPELLAEYVARPDGDPELCITQERDGALVGWFAGVPSRFLHRGELRRAVFTTFLTVERGAAGAQTALQLVQELVRRARSKGYTHAYTVFFAGTGSVPAVRRMFALCRAPMQGLLPFRFWIGAQPMVTPRLASEPERTGSIRELTEADAPAVVAAIERLAQQVPLVQAYDVAGLRAQLRTARMFGVGDDHGLDGFLLLRERRVLRAQVERNLHVELLGVAGLAPDRARALLVAALRQALDPGIRAIVIPDLGTCAALGLDRLGFLRLGERCEIACADLREGSAVVEPPLDAAVIEIY